MLYLWPQIKKISKYTHVFLDDTARYFVFAASTSPTHAQKEMVPRRTRMFRRMFVAGVAVMSLVATVLK